MSSHERESNVRYYSRLFPTRFATARGTRLFSSAGDEYIDFFGGAGALNLGHNHPDIVDQIRAFLDSQHVIHALDMDTEVRYEFISTVLAVVGQALDGSYRVQCTAPTGADAVEAALKLARTATGRTLAVHFGGSYHGMSLGALSVTSGASRRGAGVVLRDASEVAYPTMDNWPRQLAEIQRLWDGARGTDRLPACVIIEVVQGEGGVNGVPEKFLVGLRVLCNEHNVALIVDEVQTGCCRTGPFLAIQRSGIQPDIIAMSKGLTGIGLPFALLLIAHDWDCWRPGQHAGTFRGSQIAMSAATRALGIYSDPKLQERITTAGSEFGKLLSDAVRDAGVNVTVRGRGFMWGIDLGEVAQGIGNHVSRECFLNGLLVEPVGPGNNVIKLLPPLVSSDDDLAEGARILGDAIGRMLAVRTSDDVPGKDPQIW